MRAELFSRAQREAWQDNQGELRQSDLSTGSRGAALLNRDLPAKHSQWFGLKFEERGRMFVAGWDTI